MSEREDLKNIPWILNLYVDWLLFPRLFLKMFPEIRKISLALSLRVL